MPLRQSVADALRTPLLTLLVLGLCVLCAACSGAATMRQADAAMYYRTDTNATVVYAPRTHVGAKIGQLGLDATYAMDSWTGASIDVTTAATHAIHELRHEVNAAASYEFKDVTIAGNYRYSTENDYWSNGGVLRTDIEMFENNTLLSIAVLGSLDTVGRAGMPTFRRPQDSIGGRVTLSQVLDAKTVLQLSGEIVRLTGYMASPYRFVRVEGQGLCAGLMFNPGQTSDYCLPETNPHERLRTALSIKLRRALASRLSAGVEYRYYFDDWGLSSHTASPDISILVGDHGTLSFTYRFYLQSRADFYLPQYTGPLEDYQFFTRDRKLSAMLSHHVGAQYTHDVPMGESGDTVLQLGARSGLTRFNYKEFVGLKQVDALEVTGSLGLLFR
jgi:hypothetical protein